MLHTKIQKLMIRAKLTTWVIMSFQDISQLKELHLLKEVELLSDFYTEMGMENIEYIKAKQNKVVKVLL